MNANQKALDALCEIGLFLHHAGLFLHYAWCDVQMNEHSFERLNKAMEVCDAAIAALEAEQAQDAQAVPAEPVAWQGLHDPTDLYYSKPPQADVRPLYTAPQPVAVPQWIPVTERMPDDPQEVVFYSPDLRNPTEMLIGLYIRGEFKCAGHVWVNVTHWMPLPAAPGAAAPKEQA